MEICLENLTVQIGPTPILEKINFNILPSQNTAIIGAAGSGKTVMAQTILGNHFYTGVKKTPPIDQIAFVGQQHLFTDFTHTRSNMYYQQRFQSFDESTTSTVADYLSIEELASPHSFQKNWMELLMIEPLLSKNLIHLSNGENKRVQLFKAIQQKPQLIIFDQPFIGLDATTRGIIAKAFSQFNSDGITYLILSSNKEIPDSVQQVYILQNKKLSSPIAADAFRNNPSEFYQPIHRNWNIDTIKFVSQPAPAQEYVKLVNTTVRYGDKFLLKDINFTVLPHTAWCVYGHNGAGKSTLLSLITADHPQAYSNEVYLFGRRRGTGESIWEVKKNIGFVSPELHQFFDIDSTGFNTIASGLFDTIGLFRRLTQEQTQTVNDWLEMLSLKHLANKPLRNCSTGEQVLILLARACIKQPALLILDEPCQGLDEDQTQSINQLIDLLYEKSSMSLLYVTHYHHQIPKCIQQYFRLENGMGTIHG